MTYLVIFNSSRGTHKEKIHAKNWLEFIDLLNKIVLSYNSGPPDLIYLEDAR